MTCKMKKPFVSIIIPCREIDKYTEECIKHCLLLDYQNFEVLVLPDRKSKTKYKSKKIKIIPTGEVKPAIKRNTAMKKSKAEIYAFIDSDAYPEKDWLRNAVKHLQDKEIGMVGGPNLTPKNNNFRQKISGMLLATWFCGGRTSIRYRIAKEQETIELPSCNFLVKREYATDFEPDLLTAEDSIFCFNVSRKGKKVLYVPDVIVYHHRREIFLPHIRQMWIYGRDIAMLLKRKGQFSIGKLYYSMLSVFVLGVIFGAVISLFSHFLRLIYLSVILLYLMIVLASSIKKTLSLRGFSGCSEISQISDINKNLKAIPFLFIGIIATHFAYGLGFLYGLASKPKNKLNLR